MNTVAKLRFFQNYLVYPMEINAILTQRLPYISWERQMIPLYFYHFTTEKPLYFYHFHHKKPLYFYHFNHKKPLCFY